jgi:DNA-binding transcriptional regulator YdaS (Cro superfamily)
MDLKSYLHTLPLAEREAFAVACGTTSGHLRNVSYGYRTCREALAICIERESAGAVTVEELCPDADWAYIRRTAPRRRPTTEPRPVRARSRAPHPKGAARAT